MTVLTDATWSTSGSQVLHIDCTFSDHCVKGKVVFPSFSLKSEELPNRNRVERKKRNLNAINIPTDFFYYKKTL